MKGFLAAAIGVLLVAGGLAVALDLRPDSKPTPTFEIALSEGQTEVRGTVTLFKADNAVPAEPLRVPLTVPRGAATITGALVGGVRSTIAWEGGRPFVLEEVESGAGGLRLAGNPVEVDAGGARWTLDGNVSLAAARYRLRTPVAVGATGLARPRDAIEFDADDTTVAAFRNGSVVTLPLAPMGLSGPGAVQLRGRLEARDWVVTKFRSYDLVQNGGPYEVTLTPTPEGIRVMGLFQRG